MLKLWPLSQTGRLNREPTCCFDITRQTKAVERVPAATRRLFSFVGILGIPHLGDVVIRLIDYWARSDDTSGHPTGEVRRPRPWPNESAFQVEKYYAARRFQTTSRASKH